MGTMTLPLVTIATLVCMVGTATRLSSDVTNVTDAGHVAVQSAHMCDQCVADLHLTLHYGMSLMTSYARVIPAISDCCACMLIVYTAIVSLETVLNKQMQ